MEANILQSEPRTWYGTLRSMPSPVMGQNIYDVEQSITDLGGTDKSQESTSCGKDLRQRWDLKNQRLSQSAVKDPIKVTRKQIWFDLLAAGTPPGKVDRQPNTVLVSLWKTWKPKRQFKPAPPAPPIADAPIYSRRSLRGIVLFGVSASHTPSIRCRPILPLGEGQWG